MKKSDFDPHFQIAFSTMHQSKFEGWFATLASRVYGTDFELIKAGGKYGDKKSDGRRISTETIYQCYAPESPKTFAEKAAAKIQDSFPEVISFWPNIREWILVHNNVDGIPTTVSDKLEELRKTYTTISIRTATRNFLKDELHDKLNLAQLVDVYPSGALNFNDVQMTHIHPLLKRIIEAKKSSSPDTSFGSLPDEKKLDHNKLDPESRFCLQRARAYVDIVHRYIENLSIPTHANILQEQVRNKYIELRDFGYDPDDILGKLLEFVCVTKTSTDTAAGYVVLAYYFDACDIFENTPELT